MLISLSGCDVYMYVYIYKIYPYFIWHWCIINLKTKNCHNREKMSIIGRYLLYIVLKPLMELEKIDLNNIRNFKFVFLQKAANSIKMLRCTSYVRVISFSCIRVSEILAGIIMHDDTKPFYLLTPFLPIKLSYVYAYRRVVVVFFLTYVLARSRNLTRLFIGGCFGGRGVSADRVVVWGGRGVVCRVRARAFERGICNRFCGLSSPLLYF